MREAERGAGADRQSGRHDAVAAQDVEVEVGDVHGAAEAAAVAVDAPHQLGHHAVDAGALGDAVAVAAVVADDVVVHAEIRARRRRHRLLADVAVGGALHQALVEQLGRPLVEAPDLHHGRVETLELLAAELHGALRALSTRARRSYMRGAQPPRKIRRTSGECSSSAERPSMTVRPDSRT